MTTTDKLDLGYSLRKHIGNALKARSVAIRTALDRYNAAALALAPPRQILDWDQVVEYAFLSDFDLLRDARQDIRRKPWATPAARLAIDKAFKLERAEEEVARLNIEVRRLATYIRDEDICLRAKERELSDSLPALAHQVALHRMERARFNAHHFKVLGKIYLLPGGDCWSEIRGSLLEKLLLPLLLRVLPLLMKLRKREAGLVLLTKMKG